MFTKKKLNNYFFINICFHTSILFIWIQYICSIRKIENDMICKFNKAMCAMSLNIVFS